VPHAITATVRLYDRLFNSESPGNAADYRADLNPSSLEVLERCFVEPGLATAAPGMLFQFERLGYFCVDPDTQPGRLVFNRTVTLKDTWARIERRG
jgi:glutaminyl-tRNA synthetase